MARRKRTVIGEELVDRDRPCQVVVALTGLAVDVWVVYRMVHPNGIGTGWWSLDSIPAQFVEPLVIYSEVVG